MKQLITSAIILSRTDFGEADRIITLLTPDYGKLRLIAKGVRRIKSKLAGGIELFSISRLTFIQGRGEVGTLISSRLETHYGNIIQDINRTMLGYELIKQLNKATEDALEPSYFELLHQAFKDLDEAAISLDLIQLWFSAQLLKLAGHTPNLHTDTSGSRLDASKKYDFNFDDMTLSMHPEGHLSADDIKFLRLVVGSNLPAKLTKIDGIEKLVDRSRQLVQLMTRQYIR